MNLVIRAFILLYGVYFCNAGYGISSGNAQSDVEAPSYMPAYLKNGRGRGLTKTYSGTKTGYTGTKTAGTKTRYTGTKTHYTGAKTGYGGTKSGYSESKTWFTNYGSAPNFKDFHGSANQPYTPKCEPECKNNGICIDTNTCHCPANYYGKYCESEKKPCLTYPPLPMNSMRKCSSDLCTITCMEGHKFIDGSTVANMRCVEGQWQPTRADFTTIPDCEPECSPPCQNGGVCLALNTCQCPADYRGPQCQYAVNVCDVRKISFNGGYNCFGDGEKFSCKLSCPSGATFSSPPAVLYTCQYSTGIFQPQPIPHCVFNEVVVITPSNQHSGKGSNYYETHFENHTMKSHTYKTHGSTGGEKDIEETHTEIDLSHGKTESGEPMYTRGKYGQHEKPVKIIVQDFTPKGGTCLSWAGVHYKTFDGKIYSFQSPCQHILVRDAKEHKYTVAIRQGDCKRQAYCPTELTIYLEDKPYILSIGEDGSVLFRSTRRLIPIPASLPGIRVSMPSDSVLVNLDALGVTIKWDTNNLILVEGTVLLWNNTEGLCGKLDGNPENDLTTKEGMKAKTKSVLASSWQLNKIGDICDSNPTETSACASKSDEDMKKALQFCTKIFSKDKFRKCSKVLDVTLLMEACQWDYCACTTTLSPEECACKTVSVYAKECFRHGIEEMKWWRDADTCPMKCPDGKIYQSCGPDAQPSCAFPLISAKADNATCVEGCFCPEGLLLEGGRCVPKIECPCRLRNKSFKPGSVVPKDCNTCTCQAGEWTCTQVACGARCGAVGDPHYTTFDGLRYNFMGHCTYNLLKTSNLTIEVENVACSGAITEAMNLAPYKGEGKPSCTKAVNLNYGGASIHLKQGGLILVNGKEVTSLPVHVGDILIRAASSLFLIVQLPSGVDLWWDGNTRVFVDVPPEYHGKTKGLCGTFNLNQKDDFLTPEGDIEQSALAFANKWKTREFCEDIDTKEPEHPCKANVENKETAEKYCSKLMSKLFEPCHWHVDVEPYYDECVYDMCACAGDMSRCLCPILGDYAMACAKSGVKIQWRYNVKECELSCGGGQEYTVCADSCQRTCSDIALAARGKCKPRCVEGCACPPGQVLDANSVCVPVGLCPCFHKGMQFDAGYKEVRPGSRERELCTCVGARWDCVPATPDDIQNYPPAEDLRSNCSATNHMEFTTCEIAEPLTCKNMHLPPSITSQECRPGCQCKKGYVLDSSSKKCVLASECPCHHGGRSYPDGHVMQEECNKCVCKNGNWSCSTRKCAGVCGAWGDSHITTFDGTEYDFEGVCTYLLAKGVMDGNDGFDVEIQNVPCGTTGATCSKSVTLKVGSGNNEEIVSLTKNAPIPDISKLKRIKLRIAGAFVYLDVPSLGMSLQWDHGMRVYVKVDSMWQNRVKGLCGNYNSDTRDDFQTPSGGGMAESSALIFADSWKLKSTCPKPQPVRDHCKQRPERKEWAVSACGALKRYPFTLCHTEVPPGPFVERCERDACACDAGDDCRCACTALAAYAHRCAARGVTFKWRTQEMCPMQCDEECSNYDDCVSACPLETCDNTLYYEETKNICEHDTCVEGCKPKKSCPEGTVYKNNTFKECVPRAKCKPVCMTLPGGREILEGEVIEEDACHTCRCSKKQRICTGQPCSTELPQYTETTPKPHDEALKCVTGWTEWISRGPPESQHGESVEIEPLPKPNELSIGKPMCKKEMMKDIECRTVVNKIPAKETGLNVECSLERGLVCREKKKMCPDFEIKILCDCEKPEEPFQCLNSDHPNYPHPSDCSKFYECTPDMLNPDKPHTVLKNCAEGLLYNPKLMVCDWPASVYAARPECENKTTESVLTKTTVPVSITTSASVTGPTTPGVCKPGQVYSKCAYPCNKLCDHFKKTLEEKGKCTYRETCVEGCVDKSVADNKCEHGLWRDEKTCVPKKDCTCYSDGKVVKPGGIEVDGCVKCQCLNNEFFCDSSECVSVYIPLEGSTHQPMILSESLYTPSTTTTVSPVQPITKPYSVLLVKTTVTPPPECNPDSYIDLMWGDQPLPDSAFSASSVASALFTPQSAVLNGHPVDVSAGSWNPKTMDKNQYIQVELPRREPIYGVVMQGSPLFDQYVTSYEVMYGDDGNTFSTVDGPDGKPKVFRGPVDHNNPVKQMIEPPIDAKFVRIRPLTWHEEIAVRFELIGCQEPITTVSVPSTGSTPTPLPLECTEPLGLAADLPIESIEVSSNNDARKFFALDSKRGWRPIYSTPGEWIMFDFASPRNITGIKTKGGDKGWVTSYNVMYTSDLTTFNPVIDKSGAYTVFPANFDKDSLVVNEFRPPIHARYLKVLPLKWKKNIEMRVEPIGCFEPYPVTQTTPKTKENIEVTPTPCEPCPGVQHPGGCPCTSPDARYYDGENCVPRDQCPCVLSFMTYAVGSTFHGSNCDECVCKLGGITDCKPVKECKCAPNLVPKLSEDSCECLCEPCPPGTKICPTSKICLPLEKWCDGLQDCPDDEKECGTTTMRTTTTEEAVVTVVVPTAGVTAVATSTTTPKPVECPKVECPPGYMVRYTSTSSSYSRSSTSELPPPRPRTPYQRYRKGGYSKGGYAKGRYTKTGFSKTGYSKGGYGMPSRPRPNQAFSLNKPTVNNLPTHEKMECAQFKCVPKLPPLLPGQTTPKPLECSAPTCPPNYALKLETVPTESNKCPQYVCVPPPERPVFCNVTGRTINTFDGVEYKYDVCFHILARENRFDAWTVLVRKKCRVDGCVNELLIRQDDQIMLVKPNMMIEYDNYEYTVEQTSMICFQKNSFDVDRLGKGIAIKSRRYNFTVLYTSDGDVKIGVAKSLMGTVDGLCGAFDGEPSNDRSTPDGRLARSIDEFGRSWAKPGLPPNACETKVISQKKQKKAWDLCDVITKEPLSECSKVLNLDKWRSICLEKICECADLVVNGTKRTEEECRCLLLEKMVAECLAADKNINVDTWRMQNDCPADCPPPLVHYDCYRKRCEPTCSTLGSASRSCPTEDGQCFPGCYCPEGKLRKGDECVAPPDCLDCVCNGVSGPTKYVTFERDDLPFNGNCTYLASRDRNETGEHKYEVYATNGPCEENNGIVCTKIVHLIYEKRVIHISKDPHSKKLQTMLGDVPIFKYPVKKDWITIKQVNGQDISINLPDIHVELTVLQAKMEFSVRLPSYLYANRTEGLCGVCAGYESHLVTSNGTITDDLEAYTKSWQATPEVLDELDVPPQEQCEETPPEECIPPPPEQNPCYNIFNEDKFGACHPLVEPQAYVSACEAELCALNETDACLVLEGYADECRRHGVCLDWRGDLCPLPCDKPLVYRACVDCERTCDNNDELTKNPNKCNKQPSEGCFCPEGKVRVNNTCIEPTKCFPCDAKKEHYAGDEWQEDACTKCTCSKLPKENAAHVSCTTQSCATPVCSQDEDMIKKPAKPGACCPDYMCVPKPQDNPLCEEPKKMECGFGQVLKQKTQPNGCKEFACECKPASECEKIPNDSEVEIMEPGMERYVDTSGCCAKVQLLCRKETCPKPPKCPRYHELKTVNNTDKCCPEYSCELPKDKCVVKLEWEAATKGGEKPRASPQVMLKDLDSAWLDGPCRSCRCEWSPLGASPRCSVTECPAVTSTDQFVLEPRPMPFACCPKPVQVACRDGDTIYKVGENWTSPYDVCESYQCVEVEDGKLEKVTTVQTCHKDCQPGWKYFEAPRESKQCCGRCKPVACVVDGVKHEIGEQWTSNDYCTNYTCVDLDGTLQIQSSDETCPEVSMALKKQFVLKEEKVPHKCCKTQEPVACRVGNKIYQEGQTWPSPDPCKNLTCARDVTGRLTHAESVQTCVTDCKRGWVYVEPPAGECCGKCVKDACVVDDELKKPGTTWESADNCTQYSCDKDGEDVYVTASRPTCPDLTDCKPEDIVNETCCQVCKEKPMAMSTCVPKAMSKPDSIGLLRVRLGKHGLCINKKPLNNFKECRGSCDSGTIYNNQTGSHDSNCECCTAVKYEPVTITLNCEDGSQQQHRVASPAECKCQKCGGATIAPWSSKTGYHGTKTPGRKGRYAEPEEYEIPEMYARMGEMMRK